MVAAWGARRTSSCWPISQPRTCRQERIAPGARTEWVFHQAAFSEHRKERVRQTRGRADRVRFVTGISFPGGDRCDPREKEQATTAGTRLVSDMDDEGVKRGENMPQSTGMVNRQPLSPGLSGCMRSSHDRSTFHSVLTSKPQRADPLAQPASLEP